MMRENRYHVVLRLFIGVFSALLLLGVPTALMAQLNVVQISPADGTTNVPLVTDIVITFSAAVDTSAKIGDNDEPIDMMLFPDSLWEQLFNVQWSTDLKTVTFKNVQLQAGSRYVIAVVGARSTTAGGLEMPAAVTFTTAASLPAGTVSGKVTLPGGDPRGALVGLFPVDLFAGGTIAATVVTDPNGNYTIHYVPAGTYLPAAAKDVDGDGEMDPTVGDALALYDPDNDNVPDSLTVGEGQAVTGVDLTLITPQPVTARTAFAAVDPLVKQKAADAGLVSAVGAELTPQGESILWAFIYYSVTTEQFLGVAAFGPYLIPTATFFDSSLIDTTFVPDNWIDSDVAADTANAHGGADFVAQHTNVHILAGLANLDLSNFGGQPLAKATREAPAAEVPLKVFGRRINGRRLMAGKTAAAQAAQPLWLLTYTGTTTSGSDDFLVIAIDAITGEIVEVPSPFTGMSAQDLVAAALAVAQGWAADAQLVAIVASLGDLTPTGEATSWTFYLHSASKDSVYEFIFFGSAMVQMGPADPPFSADPLPQNWVDSRDVVATAEAQVGAAYRQANPGASVSAVLSRGILSSDPTRAVWAILYGTFPTINPNDAATGVLVDAETGQVISVITSVEDQAGEGATPRTFALSQNYPNPFNPETTIEFQLPVRSSARLVVTNLLGQTVAVLVDGKLPAGVHRVVWNGLDSQGRPVPSGVYLYRLEAGTFTSVRKAVLMR